MRTLLVFILLCRAALCSFAASGMDNQRDVEYRTLTLLAQMAQRFDATNSNRDALNSIRQLLGGTNVQGLIWMEDTFNRFGEQRGFENSILEKYVFVPPGIHVFDKDGGEVILVNAKPFADEDGNLQRGFVARRPERYRAGVALEKQFQEWVSKAGVTVPDPPTLAPLSRPPKQRTLDDMSDEELERLFSTNPPAGKGASGLFSNPLRTSHSLEPSRVATNAVLAVTAPPSEPVRWWLPVAVISGIGSIAYLLVRASRRRGEH